MHKAATTLAAEGFHIRWVFVSWTRSWATHDDIIVRGARWKADPISMTGLLGCVTRFRTSRRFKARRRGVKQVAPQNESELFRTHGRVVDEIRDRILRQPTDLVYAGTEGAMAPAYEAARILGVPYALDLEDLYSASHGAVGAPSLDDSLADAVEQVVIPPASFRTTSSRPIAAAYAARYSGEFAVLHNTFTLPSRAPDFTAESKGPLRLCWFSQTIGAGRGLEEIIEAIGLSRIPTALRLMGEPMVGFREHVTRLASRIGTGFSLSWSPLIAPDSIVDWCRPSEVGLCGELRTPLNRALCLTNKALLYPLAGLALACTDTEGQRELAQDFGEGVQYYTPGDPRGLAEILKAWWGDRGGLLRARRASWEAARARWHWTHAEERGKLLALVSSVLGGVRSA